MDEPKWDDTLGKVGDHAWRAASIAQRQRAIENASAFLDTLPFKGSKVSADQLSAWPRKGVVDDDGSLVEGVPVEIEQVKRLVAGFILARVPFNASALAWVVALIGHLMDRD